MGSLRAASVFLWINALGFGIPCVFGAVHLARFGEIWTLFGFPTYGHGPFERRGLPTSIWLLATFLAICILEAAAAWLLWGGHKTGAILALVSLPLGGVFWWGFALPFGPLLAVASTALLIVGWHSLI